MYNEPRHYVSVFKDFLIFDDFSEYLKRFYKKDESLERLPKVYEFYASQNKLCPTFIALGPQESKYMLKNADRKLKLQEDLRKVREPVEDNPQRLFTSQFIREI